MRSGHLTCMAAFCTLCTVLFAACGLGTSNPCSGLSYGERGPAKERYLPCAGAMLEAMSCLDRGLERAATGDEQGRKEALRSMAELRSLMTKAGGLDRLRGDWADQQLTDMNKHLCSAYEVYNIELSALGHPVKQLRGEVSRHNVALARREADEARAWYRRSR